MTPSISRYTRRLILSLLGALILAAIAAVNQRYPELVSSGSATGSQAEVVPLAPGYYPVTEFIDGDTIAVDMNGSLEVIRFIGVDTPETHHPEKPVQCFGQAAADHTRQLVGEQAVRLEADPLSSNRDRYSRLLRYVYLPDGTLLNQKIIEDGFGFAYTSFEFSESANFVASELSAKTASRGLWGNCSPNDFN